MEINFAARIEHKALPKVRMGRRGFMMIIKEELAVIFTLNSSQVVNIKRFIPIGTGVLAQTLSLPLPLCCASPISRNSDATVN